MADFLEVAEAIERPGLRLVLSAGVPGPWGESAKGLFHVKGVAFDRVRQLPGLENDALREWTGHDNAPIAVLDDEPPRTRWDEILLLAERLSPEPPLIPDDPEERALLFGLGHEICGEDGLGWCRRLMLLHDALSLPPEQVGRMRAPMERLAGKYGYSPAAAQAAPGRVAEIVGMLGRRLAAQRREGRRYLLGERLSALDVWWAAFAALLDPLPPDLCPMPEMLRRQYAVRDPRVREALDPELLAHRDRVYEQHLELPIVL